jgi:hypothetical protein
MKKFIIAALTVTAIICATASGAFQQSAQAEPMPDEAAQWPIAPAHARMW